MKSALRRAGEFQLGVAGTYTGVRQLYRQAFARDEAAHWSAFRKLYAGFVRPGETVFDIGAFVGERTGIFLALGARVVAVEPNPRCAATIRRRYRRNVMVDERGVASAKGEAILFLGRQPEHSTISGDWMQRNRDNWRWTGQEVKIELTTLDELVDKHGTPSFIKIDVESLEPEVLRGLTNPIESLSFEYNCNALDGVDGCLAELQRLGDYEFNLTEGEDETFVLTDWASPGELRATVADIGVRHRLQHGDIFARTTGS